MNLSLQSKIVGLQTDCKTIINISISELMEFITQQVVGSGAPSIAYRGAGTVDVALTNKFQYNSAGYIWYVSADGAVLVLRNPGWFSGRLSGKTADANFPAALSTLWTNAKFANAKVELYLNELLVPDVNPGGGALYYTKVDASADLNLVNGQFLANDRIRVIIIPIN